MLEEQNVAEHDHCIQAQPEPTRPVQSLGQDLATLPRKKIDELKLQIGTHLAAVKLAEQPSDLSGAAPARPK